MQVRILAVIALLVLAVAARPKWNELEGYTFEQYTSDFQKPYEKGTSEYVKREAAFTAKLGEVTAFNKGSKAYKKGINEMSDWTPTEVLSLNGRVPDSVAPSAPVKLLKTNKVSLPLSIDYRRNFPPVLTAVKNQGSCGSCWAQAAAASIESSWAIATGKLYVLSQQQMTSCVANPQQCGGSGGCYGATAQLAFDYIVNTGLTEEWQYPYTSFFGKTGTCNFSSIKTRPVARISGYASVPRNDDGELAAALFQYGPLSVSVDATYWSDYESGVYTGCDYSKNITINHAVQLIGYGHDDSLNLDYWIIRNSWSASWGESGYIRLIRNKACGWNDDWNTIGGGCPGINNNTVWACGQCGVLYDAVFPIANTN